ncbi:MAG: cation transporter [Omnitrophica WOR_2 bacterium RIFCSPHIGHO2_02_FULL_46_37]|nr:MAG: cation transporter [Omnitrophica WOR_2 bacterium RIFCSPHIGHO2_02_FULL_46_37]
MILKPTPADLKTIGYYLGKIIIGVGMSMLLPLVSAAAWGELNPAYDFIIGFLICLIFGKFLILLCSTEKDLNWVQGMVVVSLAWLAASLFGAIPFYLSGHWGSYLDCVFDAMSGFATTGLTLAQDIDHASRAVNLWRHLIMFIGGQGVVVLALSFLVRGSAGAFRMYVGEGRDEKILPNVVETSRFIWIVSIVYLILGTLALAIVGRLAGMSWQSGFFHGACIFMAAFDTGGFAPQSQNILYYHSLSYEIVTIVIMILGSLNFKLHYTLWLRSKKELTKNIETRTFFMTVMLTFFLLAVGLAKSGVYPGVMGLFRKGFYQLISGHTGTGYQTIYARQFIHEWGDIALAALIVAMGLGGAVCSTTGGIKMLRIGVVFKALYNDVKRIMLPESTVFIEKYHHIKEMILEDRQVRSAMLILLCYLGLYALGGIIGMLSGYPALEAFFESTSAAANVGLSCGITKAGMPALLKLTYIAQMWIGRLEFMSIFTLIGFFAAFVRGK